MYSSKTIFWTSATDYVANAVQCWKERDLQALPALFQNSFWMSVTDCVADAICGKERYCPPSFRTWPQLLLHLWSSIQYKLLVTNTLQIDMINHRSALKHEEKFIWETPRHFVHICQLSYVSGGRNCTYAVKWGKSDSDVRWTTKRRKCSCQSCQA